MVTRVGLQDNFQTALKELLELEYDALEAYKEAISRLKDTHTKDIVLGFQQDHEKHIKELSDYLLKTNDEIPKGPCAKQWLTKGKVVLANIMGDQGIITAMISNEDDTNTAYENLINHAHKDPGIEDFLNKAYEDEQRHKQGLINIKVSHSTNEA